MSEHDEIIECPCFRVCSLLGIETRQWCRYRKSDLPPPGMHRFDPKDDWCPTGVQASVLMLGYSLSERAGLSEQAGDVLRQVRAWAQSLRGEAAGYDPAGRNRE